MEGMLARIRDCSRADTSRWFAPVVFAALVAAIFFHAFGLTPFPAWSFWVISLPLGLFALLRPTDGMKMIIATLPLEAVVFDTGLLDAQFRLYQILAVGVAAGYVGLFVLRPGHFRGVRCLWIDKVVALLCLSVFVSAVVNGGGQPDLKVALVFLFCTILYGTARVSINRISDIREWMPYIVGSVFFSSVYAIVQSFLFERGVLENQVMDARAHGTFPEADWLGGYLALGAASLLVVLFTLRNDPPLERRTVLGRFLVVESVLFVFIALLLTVSRSAWVACAAVVAVFALSVMFSRGIRRATSQLGSSFNYLGLLAILLFVASGFIGFFGLSRFDLGDRLESSLTREQKITVACKSADQIPASIMDMDELAARGCEHIDLEETGLYGQKGYAVGTTLRPDPNTGIRMRIWARSVALVAENPFLGIGWNAIGKELGTDGRGTPLNSSNLWLEFALASGVLTAVLASILFGYVFLRSVVALRKDPTSNLPWAVLMTFAAIATFNMFNSGTFLGFLWVWLGACVSMLAIGREE